MIEFKSLACGYGAKEILKGVSLQINTHLTILGANGSGKSTLARAICGLIEYEGEIEINAHNFRELSRIDRAKTLSYIPTKLEIYDQYITVYEFVLLGRFAYKKSYFDYSLEDKNRTKQTLKFLKIEHLSEHTLSSLSSGEQQLTLIAQALAQESKIIIFDEPTANLDPHNSKIIAEHIKALKEQHQIILITHDLHLACFVGSPIAFIKEGALTLYGDDFFEDANLERLYGVAFSSMVVQYV
ncbi:MAG: ABC transporter ATP-binding protein [Sulfurimonas sp.]|jgi:iron complex transport system ATP-binding protein